MEMKKIKTKEITIKKTMKEKKQIMRKSKKKKIKKRRILKQIQKMYNNPIMNLKFHKNKIVIKTQRRKLKRKGIELIGFALMISCQRNQLTFLMMISKNSLIIWQRMKNLRYISLKRRLQQELRIYLETKNNAICLLMCLSLIISFSKISS